ncbi:hypothetical protein ACFSCZ_19440 [Siminovitchia sediminis]|uniref:N,N-dimethylformamidase alpha subunit domain-containing protein n=1 Tax=Siminovitchia sediminis TaxID=1274353 RepID=A0ABW4KNT1_9BACI
MPINDPKTFRDKTEDWAPFFAKRRQAELSKLLTEEVIEEHRLNPRGSADAPHSNELHEILNYMRMSPIEGRSFVYVMEPYKKYAIGEMTSRGELAKISDHPIYSTEEEAVHAVFLLRLKQLGIISNEKVEV